MKKFFKWAFRLVFWSLVLAAVLALFRNVIAQSLLERQLRAETGMEVSIGRVRIGVFDSTFALYDLRMFNSDDFGRTSCLDVPELYLEYDRNALLDKQIHLRRVRLDLADLQMVQNDEGKSNFQEVLQRQSSGGNPRRFEFQGIDTLNLALGRLRYSNLKDPSQNDELFIGLRNQIVHNVKSLNDIKPLITRIALERNGKKFYDKCFNRGSNSPPDTASPIGKEASSNKPDDSEPPPAKNP